MNTISISGGFIAYHINTDEYIIKTTHHNSPKWSFYELSILRNDKIVRRFFYDNYKSADEDYHKFLNRDYLLQKVQEIKRT